MYFYKDFFVTCLIFTLLHKTDTEKNPELVYQAGLETPSKYSVGLVFYINVNNTSNENDYNIEITPDECCIVDGDNLKCNFVRIMGGIVDFVSKGTTKTIKMIAPLIDQYGKVGQCTVFADSKSSNGQNNRDIIKINFDTRVARNIYDIAKDIKPCKNKDEDPFDDCKPVNCDTYYNGQRPYYSKKLKRCLEVPRCIADDKTESDQVLYNPVTNKCVKETLVDKDIKILKRQSKSKGKNRKGKDIIIINTFHPNDTNMIDPYEEDYIRRQYETTSSTTTSSNPKKHFKTFNIVQGTQKPKMEADCFRTFIKKYLIDNRWAIIVLSVVITVQCFLICAMVYCLTKTCNCLEEKKVVRKFFNYRQDASVTTPLIGTSNIDTETTDYQYFSESSNNIDQKIKCYKACQKERTNNVKMSMSDDILSKCLNRRDWKKFSKSEAITEIENDSNVLDKNIEKTEETQKPNQTKVVFEDEKGKNSATTNKTKTVSILSNAQIVNKPRESTKSGASSSEREIKCHSYNCTDTGVTGFNPNMTKNAGYFKAEISRVGSASIEKGAQAYFSNDSIDDFLSERGVIYLAGENVSKFTFSNDSNDMKQSVASSVSSKTSKNFVKNVLSLLHKRSKHGPASDPGQNKNVDVELIHMSKASIYSSSNDSSCLKSLKRKDSRTSF